MRNLAVASVTVTAIAALAFGAARAQNGPEPQDGPASRTGPTAPVLEQGKTIFTHWCAPCHANVAGLAGTLALQTKYGGSVPAALEDRTDLPRAIIAHFVRNGVAWMPPFRPTEISDGELEALSAYLTAPLANRGSHAPLLADEMVRLHGAEQ